MLFFYTMVFFIVSVLFGLLSIYCRVLDSVFYEAGYIKRHIIIGKTIIIIMIFTILFALFVF